MQKRVNADPWRQLPAEDVSIDGVKARVRGLSIRELREVTKPCKGDPEAIAEALVLACTTRSDGEELDFNEMSPAIFKLLSEAVARVNGFTAGNSSATGADDFSIA